MILSTAQQYFVDLLRSHLTMRETNAKGSTYRLSSRLGDEELWEDFRLGLNYFNTAPPALTTFNSQNLYEMSQSATTNGNDPKAPPTESLSSILETPVIMCALFFVGMRLQWFEAAKHFRYNDNGISIERVKQQDYASITNSDILAYLSNTLLAVKKTLAFTLVKPIGLWSGMVSMPRSLTRGLRGTRLGIGS